MAFFRVNIRLKWVIIPFCRCSKIPGEAGKCSENSSSQIVFRTDIFPKIAVGCPWRKSEGVLKWLNRIYRILKMYENLTVVFSVLTSCFFVLEKNTINYHLSFSEIQGLWPPWLNLACYWPYKHTSQCLQYRNLEWSKFHFWCCCAFLVKTPENVSTWLQMADNWKLHK